MSFDNPYTPSATTPQLGGTLRTADLGKRFLGFIVDTFVGLLAAVPGYALAIVGGAASDSQEMNVVGMIGMLMVFVAGLGVFIAQIYLLVTRSQSIGKVVVKTQIVDVRTGQRADFVHAFLLRMLVNGILCGLPCIGLFYFIADACYIFKDDRRCIHDHLASTTVVDIG